MNTSAATSARELIVAKVAVKKSYLLSQANQKNV